MLSNEPQQPLDDGVIAEAKPPCVALVPTVRPAQRSWVTAQLPLPDSIFITHLIATAEQLPQTRSLRRATPADARTAYRAHPLPGAGVRTRQTV